jgi:hypothetical protein
MEIRSLLLLVADDDVNALAERHAPPDSLVEDLRVRFTPDGAVVTGSCPALLLKVSFEALWALSVAEGRVVARLTSLRVAGLPAGKFQGIVLKMARDALAGRPGFTVLDDRVVVDAEEVLRREGVPLRLNLRAIRCEQGRAVVEAGAASAAEPVRLGIVSG